MIGCMTAGRGGVGRTVGVESAMQATNEQLKRVAEFCLSHGVTELALFGSVVTGEDGPESDLDVCVTFRPGTQYDVDDRDAMIAELSAIFERRVDMVPRHAVQNPYIVREIERNKRVLYAA